MSGRYALHSDRRRFTIGLAVLVSVSRQVATRIYTAGRRKAPSVALALAVIVTYGILGWLLVAAIRGV